MASKIRIKFVNTMDLGFVGNVNMTDNVEYKKEIHLVLNSTRPKRGGQVGGSSAYSKEAPVLQTIYGLQIKSSQRRKRGLKIIKLRVEYQIDSP